MRESEDLEAIVNYLKKEFDVKCFLFWGRAMGAVTIINLLHSIETRLNYYRYKK